MSTISIQVNLTTSCGYLRVLDITPWTGIAPSKRSDYGLALFIDKGAIGSAMVNDPTLTDLTNPGDDTITGEWLVNITNMLQYEAIVYQVPVYDAAETYNSADEDMVYYGGDFYLANATGITGAWDVSKWLLADSTTKAYFAGAVANASGNIYGLVDSAGLRVECDPLTLTKTACLGYQFTADGIYLESYTFALESIDGSYALSEVIAGASVTTYSFTVPSDGVYKVSLTSNTGIVYEYPIYEFCEMRSCLEGLLRSVLCQCDDICAPTGCSEETVNTYRTEINRIVTLYFPLIGMIKADLTHYYGITTISETRETFMLQVANMISRLAVIVNRCGICDDSTTTTVTDCNC